MFRLLSGNGDNEEAISAFAQGFATLTDENLDYVIDNCLAVVQRKQGESWANITANDGSAMMFQDIDLNSQVQIIAKVLRDNYQPLAEKLGQVFAQFSDNNKVASLG